MKIGAVMFFTTYSMQPAALGRALEERGFELLWVPEHTHIPSSRKTPYPAGGPLIRPYYDIMDPFLALNTAAAVTSKLKIGTGIALLTQRDPIVTAKMVSTIDQLSNGQFLFGVGNGWNRDEIENHGTDFATRNKLARERIEAMKAIWTQEEPEYHGEFVNFDKMKQWPKPAQIPHPPIIVGGAFPYAARRAIRYGNGWIPRADRLEKDGVGVLIGKFRDMATEAGRDLATMPITIFRVPDEIDRLRFCQEIDINRVVFSLPAEKEDKILPILDRWAELKRQLGVQSMPDRIKLGYLLPTREQIMEGRPETRSLLDLATRAEALGFDSVWVGDSLLARPRHDPLTLLAGVAGRLARVEIGTAVLLPALRNPVLLAHQVATLDQISEGRLILGVGIAADAPSIRAEFLAAGVPFEKRVGRMMEGLRLCRALWTGRPVDWDGRWDVKGGVLAPTPFRPDGPPIWIGGNLQASLDRAGHWFDGWFPIAPSAATFATQWGGVRQTAREAGRDASRLTGAMYLTVALDDDPARAEERLNLFLERYYSQPATVLRRRQACYAGPEAGLAEWLTGYASAGATHLMLRFAGDHERQMEAVARIRPSITR